MPQPDTKVESMGSKTIRGIFIGYHVPAGGLWSGDYLVADLAPFRKDCDVTRSKVKVHRIKEVVKNHTGKSTFPVARWRRTRELNMVDFDNSTDPEMPELCDTSDDEAPPRPPGSSSDGIGVSSERLDTLPPTHQNSSPAPGTDTRGLGLETFEGRGSVRMRKGTTRPPTIPPEFWQKHSKKKNSRRSQNTRKNSLPPPPLAQQPLVQLFRKVGCPSRRPMHLPQTS